MQTLKEIITEILVEMANKKEGDEVISVPDILHDSLSYMRFIVTLEEHLGVFLDDLDATLLHVDSVDVLTDRIRGIIPAPLESDHD
ncbi:hypothetical protein [Xenorhabdus griffiniae]|uniref:Carrier domain-containing protein n=1 Tax=Xenorhabdus griffiniae TaxID=351672 RepID=A0ABY9XJ85_9GAMM|nr:hypothetical protein [Xenorhabdus griffiniae]MBD1228694.1 hypothetical protein [Xenorhabdus griffiniae]MBE8588308.1 hypothetical protein [Xenorhabdus griffiniae]WMV72997.1 hypothetical protein QL128_02775 [Xenorhabdus griffiniae]WNH02676.1 hypothetical protein QL112_002780 [Xenorhabdus griffiniae]